MSDMEAGVPWCWYCHPLSSSPCSSESKKTKSDLSTSAAANSEEGQQAPSAVSQPMTGVPSSTPGSAATTMTSSDAALPYQGQQAYQNAQSHQEAWAAYNQYQQQQQAWAAYYGQYGHQVSVQRAWVGEVDYSETCLRQLPVGQF